MENCKVLIVDTDLSSAMVVLEICKSIGLVNCCTAQSSHEVMQCIQRGKIDLILLDITLETEYAGINLAKYLKHKYDIPCIFITGKTDAKTIDIAIQAGPYAYLPKPVDSKIFAANAAIWLYKIAQKRMRDNSNKKLRSLYHSDTGAKRISKTMSICNAIY